MLSHGIIIKKRYYGYGYCLGLSPQWQGQQQLPASGAVCAMFGCFLTCMPLQQIVQCP